MFQMSVARSITYVITLGLALFSPVVSAGYEWNLPTPAATITQEIYDLHMLTMMVWYGYYDYCNGYDYLCFVSFS